MPAESPSNPASGSVAPTRGRGAGASSARNGAAGARDWQHLARLFESLPPHAIEAEMSLLGSVLIEPQVLGDVVFLVKNADDFYKPAHGVIFEAMVELYDRHSAVDIVQLHQLLIDRDKLQAVGGLDYLVQLANAVPSAASAMHYARLVREKSTVRKLIGAAGDILYEAHHSPENAQVILGNAESRIFDIAQQTDTTQIETLKELLNATMARIEANDKGDLTGIATGFHKFDELTTGLQNSELIILAARPSMGKTALALNMAENMAARGTRVGVFSLEMSKEQLVQRLLCARSGVESQRLRRGMLSPQEFRALTVACDELVNAPIFIDDTPGLSLLQLRAKARRMATKHKVQCIVIDYLQLLTAGTRVESRQVEVSEISRGIKAMARELRVPVICLSQLNRGAENREGNRPRMSDLRESGSIEQDADVVTLLHREEYYHKDQPGWADENPDKVGVAELIIAKQRNGPTGVVNLSWIASSTRFRDHHPEPSGYVPRQPTGAAGGAGGMRNPGGPLPGAMVEPTYRPPSPGSVAPPFSVGAGDAGTAAGGGSGAFAGAKKTGPVENFRDGGGPPDRDEYDDEPPLSSRSAPPPSIEDEGDDEYDGIPI